MSDDDDRAAALTELLELVPIDVVPCLTQAELEVILDRAKLATTWTAGATLQIGQIINPPIGNGRWYQVTTPGVTGATNPFGTGGSLIADGTVSYVDYGPALESVYDVQAAACKGWLKKKGKASSYFGTPGVNMQQVFDHCDSMVNEFSQVLVG